MVDANPPTNMIDDHGLWRGAESGSAYLTDSIFEVSNAVVGGRLPGRKRNRQVFTSVVRWPEPRAVPNYNSRHAGLDRPTPSLRKDSSKKMDGVSSPAMTIQGSVRSRFFYRHEEIPHLDRDMRLCVIQTFFFYAMR